MWLRTHPKGLHMLPHVDYPTTHTIGSLYWILGCSTVSIAKGMGKDLRTETWNRILWWRNFGLINIIQILDILYSLLYFSCIWTNTCKYCKLMIKNTCNLMIKRVPGFQICCPKKDNLLVPRKSFKQMLTTRTFSTSSWRIVNLFHSGKPKSSTRCQLIFSTPFHSPKIRYHTITSDFCLAHHIPLRPQSPLVPSLQIPNSNAFPKFKKRITTTIQFNVNCLSKCSKTTWHSFAVFW